MLRGRTLGLPPPRTMAKGVKGALAILLIDGECALCSRLVQFVGRRDSAARLRFGTLQSDAGLALLRQHRQPTDLSTVVLIEYAEPRAHASRQPLASSVTAATGSAVVKGGVCSTRSTAALRTLLWLDGWRWAALARMLLLVPRPLRNLGYELVGRLRYRMWGRTETCGLPPAWLHRRIITDEHPPTTT